MRLVCSGTERGELWFPLFVSEGLGKDDGSLGVLYLDHCSDYKEARACTKVTRGFSSEPRMAMLVPRPREHMYLRIASISETR